VLATIAPMAELGEELEIIDPAAELGAAELGAAELGAAELGAAELGVAELGVAELGAPATAQPRPSLWRHANYMKIWLAATVSLMGSQVSQLAIPYIAAVVLRSSPFEVAMIGAVQMAPSSSLPCRREPGWTACAAARC
jgi:hypothetical protein